jgi:acyl-coenzyme A synthetase/AMP-(fatty) acid ligase
MKKHGTGIMTMWDRKCPVVDTWWQTETGGIMIAQLHLLRQRNQLMRHYRYREFSSIDG